MTRDLTGCKNMFSPGI